MDKVDKVDKVEAFSPAPDAADTYSQFICALVKAAPGERLTQHVCVCVCRHYTPAVWSSSCDV